MLILEWESAGRGGGWGVSAVRLFAYQCRADTAPMVLRDRWGMSKCVFLCTYVSVGCECHWTPGQVLKDGFAFESRCTLLSLPFLHFCLVPSLPQESYGESDLRDSGPCRECSFPQFICSRRVPAGHSGSPEVPDGWESGRVSGMSFRSTASVRVGWLQ